MVSRGVVCEKKEKQKFEVVRVERRCLHLMVLGGGELLRWWREAVQARVIQSYNRFLRKKGKKGRLGFKAKFRT